MMKNQNIGRKIRILRKKKGLKQNELAEKVGISRPYLSNIERNKQNPSYYMVKKITNALDSDIGKLEEVREIEQAN